MIETSLFDNRIVVPRNAVWLPDSLRNLREDLQATVRFPRGERRVFKRKRLDMKPSEFVKQNLRFSYGDAKGQPMDFSDTPYTAAILDASFLPYVREITVASGPQMLKTTLVEASLGTIAEFAPGPALIVYPDEKTCRENNKDRFQELFNTSPGLNHLLTGYDADMASLRIKLTNMLIYMGWAGSATALANKTIRYLFNDEKAKFPLTPNKDEAGSDALASVRTNRYRYNKKHWNLSTVKRENDLIWQDLTVRAEVIFKFFAQCPYCLEHQLMLFGDRESPTGIKWPKDERDPERIINYDLAWYQCCCGAKWNSFKRDRAVRNGEFRAESDGRELFAYMNAYKPVHPGFHLPSWNNPTVTLGDCAGAFLKGARNKIHLRHFNNNIAVEPSVDYQKDEKAEIKRLKALQDDREAGMVPGNGVVAALMAGVDTQDNGFYYKIKAFGYGLKHDRWLIRKGFVTSLEALEQVLWEDVYMDLAGEKYPVHLAVQDAMGHRTKEVYDFCIKHRGWILPSKGQRTKAQSFTFSNLEFYPGNKKPLPGGLQLVNVNTTLFKDNLDNLLNVAPTDPGAYHFHADMDDDYLRQMTAEYRDENGFWEQIGNRANHYWDCDVLCEVAAEIVGVKHWAEPGTEEQDSEQEDTEPTTSENNNSNGRW